jgi:hypothetical protein
MKHYLELMNRFIGVNLINEPFEDTMPNEFENLFVGLNVEDIDTVCDMGEELTILLIGFLDSIINCCEDTPICVCCV